MSGTEEQFRSLILEGLFQERDGRLVVLQAEKELDVEEHLLPFRGRMVRVVIHYAPPVPDKIRWGMGCCHWEGECPVGHHKEPGKMLLLQATGLVEGPPWAVSGTSLPLSQLPGHDARLILVSDFKLPALQGVGDVTALMEQMGAMRQFLVGLAGVAKEK